MPAAPSPGLVEAWRDVMVSGWHEVKKGRRKTARQSRFCSEADYAEPSLDKAPSVDILPEPAPAAKCQNTDDVVDRFETPTRWLVDELCRSTAREAVSDLPPSCCASGSWQLVVERTFISVAPRSDGQRYTASAPGRLVGPHPPSCRPAARAKAVQGAVEPDLVDEAAELWPTAGAECSSSSEGLPDSEAGEAEDTDVEGANDHSEVDAGNEDGEQGNNDEAENLAEDSEPEATAPLAEEETEEQKDEDAQAEANLGASKTAVTIQQRRALKRRRQRERRAEQAVNAATSATTVTTGSKQGQQPVAPKQPTSNKPGQSEALRPCLGGRGLRFQPGSLAASMGSMGFFPGASTDALPMHDCPGAPKGAPASLIAASLRSRSVGQRPAATDSSPAQDGRHE
eukprot:gnl/TRDRNA2_/TRDRNA2_169223_c1_seq2.p1 gnl/TRDRNA2_/TRDRNA2_169223_c1~~gnl/TRDRNA2_/TRDRNA2_169223_c1_seq2.p1  ORF type:complete len:399 (+),score=79.06 gnl/TRDRNA2_/TRDRNA2_169223_c1_seq2:109-1305(+)